MACLPLDFQFKFSLKLAHDLYVEQVIVKQQLDTVCKIANEDEQREELMKILNLPPPNTESTLEDTRKLRIFSTLLIRNGDTQRGKDLLPELLLNISQLQSYKSHNEMIKEVSDCFEGHVSSLNSIVDATECYKELHNEIKLAKSVPEAVTIIGNRLSLLNLFYLEKLCTYFELENALSSLKSHHLQLKSIEKMTIQDAADNNLVLMPNYKQALLISEEILIEMDGSIAICSDLKDQLANLFCQMSCHVMPYSVTAAYFVSVRCYAPPYMHAVLTRLAIDNKDNCAADVLSVSIGGSLTWNRNLGEEKNLDLKQSKEKMIAELKKKNKELSEDNLALKLYSKDSEQLMKKIMKKNSMMRATELQKIAHEHENEDLRKELRKLRAELDEKNKVLEKFQKIDEENEELHKEFEKMRMENDELHKELEKCHMERAELHKELEKCHMERAELRKELEKFQMEKEEFHIELQKLLMKIEELQKELQKCHMEKKELQKEFEVKFDMKCEELKKEFDKRLDMKLDMKCEELRKGFEKITAENDKRLTSDHHEQDKEYSIPVEESGERQIHSNICALSAGSSDCHMPDDIFSLSILNS